MSNKIKMMPAIHVFHKIIIKAIVYSLETKSVIIRCLVPNKHYDNKQERPFTINIRLKGKIISTIKNNLKIDNEISITAEQTCVNIPLTYDILKVKTIILYGSITDLWPSMYKDKAAIKHLEEVQPAIHY